MNKIIQFFKNLFKCKKIEEPCKKVKTVPKKKKRGRPRKNKQTMAN